MISFIFLSFSAGGFFSEPLLSIGANCWKKQWMSELSQ